MPRASDRTVKCVYAEAATAGKSLPGESLTVLLEIIEAEAGHESPHTHNLREILQDSAAVLEPLVTYLVRVSPANLESEIVLDCLLDRDAICR